ncbi:hypothetical protein FA15DRAFT_428969 [Coprinopsis marcescibilis]|uniref:Uncharacterized protein n=1 Tax=Coprinopsis marcescibilis TaxID=230819 RepID=A0A5C3L8T1_COPMA|nr:hypothetical protein FA15DRAFT_428969 [Coprinopsis marcescibilis]
MRKACPFLSVAVTVSPLTMTETALLGIPIEMAHRNTVPVGPSLPQIPTRHWTQLHGRFHLRALQICTTVAHTAFSTLDEESFHNQSKARVTAYCTTAIPFVTFVSGF